VRRSPGLLFVSLIGLAAAIVLSAAAPLPSAESIEDTARLEWLWRDGAARRASGFTLLGLALAATLLSARKRWRRTASLGPFSSWRFAHAVIGVLTLAALAVHTGGRAGDNLNFALVSSFGTLNVLGAIAGGAAALEQRLGGRRGRALRAALVTAHILAIWPLPVLITFHVLSVYYF
jgi:nitrite reductase (NADH) large subunit